MRKFMTFLSIVLISSIAHADDQTNRLFDCMDNTSFEVNGQCVEAKISQNMQFREMQMNFEHQLEQSSDNVLATATLYPKQMLIEIVAHKDAIEIDRSLVASN